MAQDTITNLNNQFMQDKLESIGSLTDKNIDYSTLIDHLNQYKLHPLNMNKASREEFQELGLLNDVQITSILNHIKEFGLLIETYELLSIDGLNQETIQQILPYITVVDVGKQLPLSLRNILTKGRQDFSFLSSKTLEQSIGFATPFTQADLNASKHYLGSPYRRCFKYHYTFADQLSIGFTGENDAGEQFKKGFDFNSAHLFYKGKGIIKTLAVGDYQLGFGQGLCLSSGMSFSKTGDVLSIKKMSRELMPYTAINENAFMRGIALTLKVNNFEFTPFYSYHKLDGNSTAIDTLTQKVSIFSSLGTSGYHRTYNELKDKHIIGQSLFGGHLAYNTDKLNIGITAYQTKFDAEYLQNIKPYNQFEFQGKTNMNYSLDYSYSFKNYNLFGEFAESMNSGKAFLGGLLMSVDSRTSISILYRNYQKEYQALQSNGFGEGSGTSNEEGIYVGISSNLNKSITISAYYDNFSFPWLKYLVPAPSFGNEYFVQVSYTPDKKFQMNIRFKNKSSQNQSGYSFMITPLVKKVQDDFRWTAQYIYSNTLLLKSRIEMSHFARGDEVDIIPAYGYLITQDVVLKIPKAKLSFSFRYAIFDCDSYYTRMYCYEDDMPNSFSIPSFYGQGSRSYLMVKYKLNKNIDIWFRYAQTYYYNVIAFGTGLDLIKGNTKTDVSAELRIGI